MVNTPFETEEKLESFVYQNQDLLEDIFIFKRQIRSGNHQGIPDMLGVDQDGKICLLELKNVMVTEEVLPQILGYAIWAETNPDSIKALWLEAKHRPDDIEINWDNFELRVLIIGPTYRDNVLHMSQRIGYSVELLQLTRFVSEDEEFILIDQHENNPTRKVKTTKGMEAYGREYYEREHGAEPTAEYMKAISEMEALAKQNGWLLETKFNKYHTGLMYGGAKPFGTIWGGTKAWTLHIRISEAEARAFECENWTMHRYDVGWKLALFRKTNPQAHARELEPLLALAYEKITGKK